MKKIYCIKCNKNKKFKNLKISYIFEKILVLFISCSKYGNEDKKMFKKKSQLRY